MKKSIISKFVIVFVLLTMVLSLASCQSKSAAGSKIAAIKKAGKLVVGTSADYPPYEFHKQVNGKDEIVGFDIDIAKEIAKDLGVKLEIKEITFKGLLEALQAGKIDMVIAGMNPTAERAKSVDFSKVYYTSEQAVMVRKEDKDKLKTLADLKGKKVGAQMASVQEDLVKSSIPGAELKSLGAITDLILDLKTKKVDALVVELTVSKSYAEKNKDLYTTDMQFDIAKEKKGSAVAMKKGSSDLVESVNKTIDRLTKSKSIEKFVIDATNLVQ